MKNFLFETHQRMTRIVTLLLCMALLAVAGYYLYFPQNKELIIQIDGNEVYRQSVFENAVLLVQDGNVIRLESDQNIDLNTSSAINVIELENGTLRCAASNCADQQCVYSGEIDAVSNNDMLVCYEHKLIISIQ